MRLIPSLRDLLKEIRTEVEFDEAALESEFRKKFNQSIEGTLERNKFGINNRIKTITEFYVTEQPSWLYIEFEIQYDCVDLSGEGRSDGLLTLRGVGRYDAVTGAVGDLQDHGESLSFTPSEGGEKLCRVALLVLALLC